MLIIVQSEYLCAEYLIVGGENFLLINAEDACVSLHGLPSESECWFNELPEATAGNLPELDQQCRHSTYIDNELILRSSPLHPQSS